MGSCILIYFGYGNWYPSLAKAAAIVSDHKSSARPQVNPNYQINLVPAGGLARA